MENNPAMQQMIARILENDKKARALTAQAVARSAEANEAIAQRVETVRSDYIARAKRRVEAIRVAETECAKEELMAIEKRHAEVAQRLDKLLEEKGSEWVDTLVTRVIGDRKG